MMVVIFTSEIVFRIKKNVMLHFYLTYHMQDVLVSYDVDRLRLDESDVVLVQVNCHLPIACLSSEMP
jgi:hypothetical protein